MVGINWDNYKLHNSSFQLEYVRYGIEMQKGTQTALRNQQKTIAKRKNNIRNIGSKTIYKK